jgi:hypothetical protein
VSKLDRSVLIVAAGTLGAGLVMYPAYAFNVQQGPPAKVKISNVSKNKSGGTFGWRSVSPGPCKTGTRCQAPYRPKTGQ